MAKKETKKRSAFAAIAKEFKRIQWPRWKSNRANHEAGILETFVKVVSFTAVFAVFFILCDVLIALAMRTLGI